MDCQNNRYKQVLEEAIFQGCGCAEGRYAR